MAETPNTPKSKSSFIDKIKYNPYFEFFYCPDTNEAYVDVTGRDNSKTIPLQSSAFSELADHFHYKSYGYIQNKYQAEDTLNALLGYARYECPHHKIHGRVADFGDDGVQINLGNGQNDVISVTRDGWKVQKATVKFATNPNQLPLPKPQEGGDINKVFDFINIQKPDDKIVFIAALVKCFLSDGAFPVMVYTGREGCGKSSSMGFTKMLIDPCKASRNGLPNNDKELFLRCNLEWLIECDNVSTLKQDQSDLLARISTGADYSSRAMYKNKDLIYFKAKRPILLNGIGHFVTKGDLASRCLTFHMDNPPVYKTEGELMRDFESSHPFILGQICDALVDVLRQESVISSVQGRLKHFYNVGNRIEKTFKWPRGTFDRIIQSMQDASKIDTVMGDPLGAALLTMLKSMKGNKWEGTSQELMDDIRARAFDLRSVSTNPSKFSSDLTRLESSFEALGITIKRHRTSKERKIVIKLSEEFLRTKDQMIADDAGDIHNSLDWDDTPF